VNVFLHVKRNQKNLMHFLAWLTGTIFRYERF
jgi:hypothetical protein